MAEPLILSIETCTLAGSLALSRGRELIAASEGDARSSHSNTLLKELDALLRQVGIALHDVDLFAVAAGPGSFTGLRIGIATVKALATTLGKPALGIPTLEAIALSAGESDNSVALLPAGRGEVFAQLFSVNERQVSEKDIASHLSPSRMLERYSSLPNVLWCGPGVDLNRELLKHKAAQLGIGFEDASGWRVAPVVDNLAIYCGEIALQKFESEQVGSQLRALYVRPSDAELNSTK